MSALIYPNAEEALQFAMMLDSGMPSTEAIRYFHNPDGESEFNIKVIHDAWMRSQQVKKAVLQLQGKMWQEMSVEERIKYAINKHYSEMAYFLYAHNYASLTGADKTKADTCRAVLETKLAGMAGKMDALTRFYDDVANGRVKLAPNTAKTPS